MILLHSATCFCLVARELLTSAWNTAWNDTSSAIEGSANSTSLPLGRRFWSYYYAFPSAHLIVVSCLLVPYHPLRLWDVSDLPPEFRYWCHHVMWQICAYLMSVKAVLSHKSLVWFILRRIAKYGGPIPPLSWELWPRWLGIVCPRKLVRNREPEIETFISRAVDGRFASFKAQCTRL